MDDALTPFEDPIEPRPVRQGKWPHKCDGCGQFVKHDQLRSVGGGWYVQSLYEEYWATAHCGNCDKRVNANPI